MIKLEECPNVATYEAFCKAYRHLLLHDRIMVSISGGADSDIMLDLLIRVAKAYDIPLDKFHFVFFNTGIEYQATLKHLDELEEKYGITIERERPKKSIPIACKEYGLPFLSKDISAKINSLQNNKFDFAHDGGLSYEELAKKYPKCKSVLRWWCNEKPSFNINTTPYLKEFMIANPPPMHISSRCCDYSKKMPSKQYEKENNIDLKVLGLRKSEGGVRATAYKSCFTEGRGDEIDLFLPLWWLTDSEKKGYKNFYKILHNDCYEVWGFKRTGCAGCPYNSNFEKDLTVIERYEPKIYKAINNIFKDSYEYTRAYLKFREEQKQAGKPVQLKFF